MDEQTPQPAGQVTESSPPHEPELSLTGKRRVRLGAVIALALAAGFIAWLVVSRNESSSTSAPTSTATAPATVPGGAVGAAGTPLGPVAVSASRLATLAKAVKSPIYWAGRQAGFTYELTETSTGKVYVRYLPKGVKAGDPRASFLIIATYPFPDAFTALKNVAKRRAKALPGGGIAFVDTGYPKSVHVAFPGVAYQVEVYDPSPQRSRQVALSGDVKPVR